MGTAPHRLGLNEYSTRYTEAIDEFATTPPHAWRSQSQQNKQGSGDFLTEAQGSRLSDQEGRLHALARRVYRMRLNLGVAKEQARKDLPLSTYTRVYWKCDVHNLMNFIRLRTDDHAQLEIREYAYIVRNFFAQHFPLTHNAFMDYVVYAMTFSYYELIELKRILAGERDHRQPEDLTDREWREFKEKLTKLGHVLL